MKDVSSIHRHALMVRGFIDNPDKYVYPFLIKEKNDKERRIITYNKFGQYGISLRKTHEAIIESFRQNFSQRNLNSFAYHKNVRCYDALQSHLKSNYFIKLDIHHFFESITKDKFFELYGDYFNDDWKEAISGLFYRDSLSIGFVSSPEISDFFMKKFDNSVDEFIKNHPGLHYSRYSDDLLLSSELDNDKSLEELFSYISDELAKYNLEINHKKTRRIKLDYISHNSISYLGLNISKMDEVNNKITISKRYILFLLFLIKKQKGYKDHCYQLDNEIKSRIAYLAYNSPISYQRFQKKYFNLYGEPYYFTPKVLDNRSTAQVSDEIPNYEEYSKLFKINIHKKIVAKEVGGFAIKDAIEIEKYIGKGIKEVTIPYFVESIGESCFAYSDVEKVVLSERIKNISAFAFASCYKLKEIVFPKSLRYIGNNAFAYCGNLSKITIPESVKVISHNTFENSGLKEINLPEGLEIIGPLAFANTSIGEINFPSTLKEIQENAFDGCSSLVKTNLKESNVEQIGNGAFNNCSILEDIDLPETLLIIGDNAFSYCNTIRNIRIPASVMEISPKAFKRCARLTSIDVSEDNKVYLHRFDNKSIVEAGTHTLVFSIKEEIDDDILAIGNSLYENSNIKNIVIPEGVTSIGNNAFKYAKLLKDVSLPNSLMSLGNNVFEGCLSLEEITIPDKVRTIPDCAFTNCPRLRKIHMSDKVQIIGDFAFRNDIKLEINLPKGLLTIGSFAFANCINNKTLFIPSKVKHIKKNAFLGLNKNLESIKVDPLNIFYSSGVNSNCIYIIKKGILVLGCKNTTIDRGITIINQYAFSYTKDLKEISLPDTVKIIGDYAFKGCENLSKVNLNLITHIGRFAFADTKMLEHLVLPSSLVSIDDAAFDESSLNEIVLPNSLVHMGNSIFHHCRKLKEITVHNSFTFTKSIFEGCSNLEHISVSDNNPNYLTGHHVDGIIDPERRYLLLGCLNTVFDSRFDNIADDAFLGNDLIKEIVIPAHIKNIGSGAFYDCHNLRKIKILANIKSLENNTFTNCFNLEEVYLPSSLEVIGNSAFESCMSLKSIDLGKDVERIGHNVFLNSGLERIVLPKGIDSIPYYAFKNCHNLKEVILPNGIKTIGGDAFMNTAIEEINLPTSINNIQTGVFNNCVNLKSVTLPPFLRFVPETAFKDCKSLIEVKMSEGIAYIGTSAFENCTSLKDILLADSIEEIRTCAFRNCASLEKVNFPSSLKQIYTNAFAYCSNLVLSKFPDSLENIGTSAFAYDKKIKNIYLPRNVKLFDNSSFYNCNIESIEVDEKNEHLFSGNNGLYYHDDHGDQVLLLGCKNTIILEGTNAIASYAFNEVDSLEKIDFPSSLETIRNNAIINCKSLKEIKFPPHLLEVEPEAFRGCVNVKNIELNDELTSIGNNAFNAIKVNKIIYPSSLKEFKQDGLDADEIDIKDNKLYYCKDNVILTKGGVVIKTSNSSKFIDDKLTIIGDGCFNNLHFKEVIFKEGLIIIGKAFNNCGVIDKLYIPASVKRINPGFANNTIIKQIIVDKDNPYFASNEEGTAILDSFKEELYYISNEMIIPEGVSSIKGELKNDKATKLYVPSTLITCNFIENIKKNPIEEVEVSKDNPILASRNNNSIIDVTNDSLIYITSKGNIPEDISRISQMPFSFRDDIEEIFIPKNINYIKIRAFKDNKNIKRIKVDKDNPIFDSRNDCNAIILSDMNLAILTCENTKLPEGVTVETKYDDDQYDKLTTMPIMHGVTNYLDVIEEDDIPF